MAAVHCVIVGFGAFEIGNKIIYEYDDIRGEPHAVNASNINPYLVDAADVAAAPVHPIATCLGSASATNLSTAVIICFRLPKKQNF
jgi:hypothetical protein